MLAVSGNDHVTQSASSVTHQEMFRLIAINNKLRTSRLGHDDWVEGLIFMALLLPFY